MSNFTKQPIRLTDSCQTHAECGDGLYCAQHLTQKTCVDLHECKGNNDAVGGTCPPEPEFNPCACDRPCGSESKYNGKDWCYIDGWKSNPGDGDGGCELAGVEEGSGGDWKYCTRR